MMHHQRVVSLWDMLKDNAAAFVDLGERLASAQALWGLYAAKSESISEYRLNDEGKNLLRQDLDRILKLAIRLNLPLSKKLVERRLNYKDSIPETPEEFSVITEVLMDELAGKLFLFVPSERAGHWEKDDLLSSDAKAAFPSAAAELRAAGNAYAAALPTGSVFYSMRAVEHGLRALSADVELVFDIQQWGTIINQIQAKIEEMRKNGIPGVDKLSKDARLQFLSEAAKEFAYFKDGWRNYVSHAKAPYTEHQAITVLNHVADFIERISARLRE